MTSQDKIAATDTVEPNAAGELDSAALDQAVGGDGATLLGIDYRPQASSPGVGILKSMDGGRTW